jgi:NADH-quinone oxidoreductase subunit J
MQLTLFLVFALLALAGGINLLLQRHPIYSALSLVTVMGALAVEYLLLGAEFIAFIQIIVYAGAIMVLFVFVIMVLNAGEVVAQPKSRVAAFLGLPLLTAFGIVIITRVTGTIGAPALALGQPRVGPATVGDALFHRFLLPFEVTSVLFLVGILGAVVLAARRPRPQPAATPAPLEAPAADRAAAAAGK